MTETGAQGADPTTIGQRLQRLAAVTGERYTPCHEPSWWLRSRLVDLHTRAQAGQLTPCSHARPGQILHTALWSPDRVVCAGCTPCLKVTGDADRTCDRCGTTARGVHPLMVAATPTLLVTFGLCAGCLRRELGQ